ncbi:6-phosphogluconate phosphatase [Asticcacaulis sp. MM231]|uniref:HAD family hydrolase n=1 Tax=Asticcacaulis sp. MM231 TaxID=3157666 RepID=UPI0032D59F4B
MKLIIFDFDGVIADSKSLACMVLVNVAGDFGITLTVDEAVDKFVGKRLSEVVSFLEVRLGRTIPGISDLIAQSTLSAFSADLKEVRGFGGFLQTLGNTQYCIASSSSPVRLKTSLDVLGLSNTFARNVFSAESVDRGKPFPDIFLYAASQMGVQPADCLVIEDSVAGVIAARAADMAVIGLLAGSHIKVGHKDRLIAAGATFVATSYDEITQFLAT